MHKIYSQLMGLNINKFITVASFDCDIRDYISNCVFSYGDGKGYVLAQYMRNYTDEIEYNNDEEFNFAEAED